MPEDLQAQRKKKFDPVRIARIVELSKQWKVPTQSIYSTVHWGYDEKMDIPDRTDYFTIDAAGNTQFQKIDYGPVIGWPAGVYSPKNKPLPPGSMSDIVPNGIPMTVKPAMRNGGAIRRKAQYGDILPVGRRGKISAELENDIPVDPLPVKDMRIANFFNSPLNRRLIPGDASLVGPQPGQVQQYIDGQTGEIYQDGPDGPVPVQQGQQPAGSGTNMRINAGGLITGFNAALNQVYDHSRAIKEFSRLKRKQLQSPEHNPYAYGTGSSAIYRKGGTVVPVGESMGTTNLVYEFNGPSHEQGGIPIRYAGRSVEVEGGETAYQGAGGDLHIFGDLTIPGSNMKFKTAGRKIGELEDKLARKLRKAQAIMEQTNTGDKFDSLRFNTARLQLDAASSHQQAVSSLKEKLSLLQEQVLDQAGHSFTQAKKGMVLEQEDPKKKLKPSMAMRHNNPGNIKYADWLAKKYGAVKGERSADGDNFARFPDADTGLRAMKGLLKGPGYKKLSVEKALQRWSNTPGYKLDLGDLKDKTMGTLGDNDLKRVMDIITQGEDSKLYDLDTVFSTRRDDPNIDRAIHPPVMPLRPINYPDTPGIYTNMPPDPAVPRKSTGKKTPLPGIDVPPSTQRDHPNPLAFSQIAPELLALGDRPDFVPGQRYEPNLFQPYQVSFQDRLNENQATFNRVAAQAGNNPAALSLLAGQKYMADSSILADEFRTNQGVTSEITNKNISLLNDAQLRNLQLADTQFVRQAQATANTRQNIYNAVNALSSKIGQNRLETRAYNAISSMFPQYDFDQDGNMVYLPNDNMQFGPLAGSTPGDSYYQRTRDEYDGSGKLKKKMINTPSEAEQSRLDYQNWNNQLKKRMSMLNAASKLRSTS